MTRPLCLICHERQSYRDTKYCRQCNPDALYADRAKNYDKVTDYFIAGPNWGRNTRLADVEVKMLRMSGGFEPGDKVRRVTESEWRAVV